MECELFAADNTMSFIQYLLSTEVCAGGTKINKMWLLYLCLFKMKSSMS